MEKEEKRTSECSDSTDSMSKNDPDPAQTVAGHSLGNPPETLVSQAPSLPSFGDPDHELPIPLTPSLEHDWMVQDCFPLALLKANVKAHPRESTGK